MPFKSIKQRNFIQAAAHNPDFAKKVGMKQVAAQKFVDDSKPKLTLGMEPDEVKDPMDDVSKKANPFKSLKLKLKY